MKYQATLCRIARTGLMLTLAAGCDSSSSGGSSGGTAGSAGIGGGNAGNAGNGGSGGAAAGNGGNGGASGAVALLVDDFEDGDDRPLISGAWYQFTDVVNGGNSTMAFTGAPVGSIAMNGPGYQSNHSLEISYTFDQATLAYQPYIGFGVGLASSSSPLDLHSYGGIAYVYRGGAHRVRVETFEVTDYDFFGVELPASTSWKAVSIPFQQLTQEGWGKKVSFDPSHVGALSYQLRGQTGQTGQFDLDTLTVVAAQSQTPDMTVHPAQPPAETEAGPIEIDNPLQSRAETYLSRGYNLTNWLEQARFSGFTHDEDFVAKLAQAGFKSLRLPIDLDLYIEDRSGTGDDLQLTLDDDLFTILDSFSEWTQKYGLSLTIDYHQYDRSLNVADADSVRETIVLWGKVAAHFADEPREDLFYELLNEPELSVSGTAPTQAEWTSIAERMVAAIRESDTVHTIIFGDTQWYGIDTLSSRQPLSDDNVIYAFHDYDPFIFTHQGASWATMASTHDLPYPYQPERWSQYYSELGFGQFMESWILSSARDYYRTGNRAALWNQIVKAKRWAVDHDVPVICNEFGAYDQTSRLEDRARYYTDVIGIFDELHIPWQHWFMIMDDQGRVIPEYRQAMKLDQ